MFDSTGENAVFDISVSGDYITQDEGVSGIEFHKSLEVLKKIKEITESNYDDADAKKLLLEIKGEILKLPEAVLLLI